MAVDLSRSIRRHLTPSYSPVPRALQLRLHRHNLRSAPAVLFLRALPISRRPALRPLNHRADEPVDVRARVARVEADADAVRPFRHRRPRDRARVEPACAEVRGERARVRGQDGDDRRRQRGGEGRCGRGRGRGCGCGGDGEMEGEEEERGGDVVCGEVEPKRG